MEPPILICAQPLDTLGAGDVGRAVADGIVVGGRPQPDILEFPSGGDVKALLTVSHFDERMRAAFAVVICTRQLRDGELRGTLAAELATSARQAGVACHAICGYAAVSPFTARIYDLQTIRTAASAGELRAAGSALTLEL